MEYCDGCGYKSWSKKGLNIHIGKFHKSIRCVDLIKMGVIKRKLTRKEVSKVTKEVMAMDLNPDARFNMAIIKTIGITN